MSSILRGYPSALSLFHHLNLQVYFRPVFTNIIVFLIVDTPTFNVLFGDLYRDSWVGLGSGGEGGEWGARIGDGGVRRFSRENLFESGADPFMSKWNEFH